MASLYCFLLLCCLCRQLPLPHSLRLLAAPFGNRFLIDLPPPIFSSPLIHPPHLQQQPLKQLCPFISLPCWKKKKNPLPYGLLCCLPWEFQTFQKQSCNSPDNVTTHRTAPCAVFGPPFHPRYPAYDHPPSLEFLSCTPNLALQGVSHSSRTSMHPALVPTGHPPSFAGFTLLLPSPVQLLSRISINSVLHPPERVPSWHTASLLLQVARMNAWTPTTSGKTGAAPVSGKHCGNVETILVVLVY